MTNTNVLENLQFAHDVQKHQQDTRQQAHYSFPSQPDKCLCSNPDKSSCYMDFISALESTGQLIITQLSVGDEASVWGSAQSVGAQLLSHHFPIQRVIEPLQQLDGGALPTAAASHQGQSFSLLYTQIQPLQDGYIRTWRIIKLDPLKGHITIKLVLEEKRVRYVVKYHFSKAVFASCTGQSPSFDRLSMAGSLFNSIMMWAADSLAFA